MSVNINIKNAIKRYGENTILSGLSVNIKEGELFTLLGPSGCGKTTLLRMIAGFNSIEGGEFYFNDSIINQMSPSKRNIGMVFQNYAIFPHLTVRENVKFGLKNRKLSKEEINQLTDEMLKTMQIEQYADRLPEKLSGGQQQRVALARAIVIKPDVLLMDEPLSNLDAKLRVEMRSVIRDIQRSVGITTVYVTHDQEEAMSISDRIAVMKDGFIQHIGTPKNIYQRPANTFVATFIGRSNMIKGQLKFDQGKVILKIHTTEYEMKTLKPSIKDNQDVIVSIRPEEFYITDDPSQMKGEVIDYIFLGLNTHYTVRLESDELIEIVIESSIDSIIPPGSQIHLGLKLEKINVFTQDGSENCVTGVENDNVQEKAWYLDNDFVICSTLLCFVPDLSNVQFSGREFNE